MEEMFDARKASNAYLFKCGCITMVVDTDFIIRPCSQTCRVVEAVNERAAEMRKPMVFQAVGR